MGPLDHICQHKKIVDQKYLTKGPKTKKMLKRFSWSSAAQ